MLEVFNSIYYKEIPLVTGDMDETIIVTYSPKYKAYQQKIRSKQLDRAQKMVDGKIKKRKGKNQNDPARFVKETKFTNEGEIAENETFELDQDRISEEAKYDGFYAVITNLEDNVEEILKINKQRWEIEENFRIMKTDFEARPVYVRRDDRIKAHFLTCYISLLVYRLLEKKLDNKYTCEEILSTIREMQMTLLSEVHLCNDPKKYKYLNTGSGQIMTVPTINDKELFDELKSCFESTGFTQEEILTIFKVVAAVLLLGNVNMDVKNDKLVIEPKMTFAR